MPTITCPAVDSDALYEDDVYLVCALAKALITECTVHVLCLYGDTVHLIQVWAICLTTPSKLSVDP